MAADESNPTSFESLSEMVFEIADTQEQQRSVEINFTSYPAHLLGSNRKPLFIHYAFSIEFTKFLNALCFVM